MRVTLNAIGPPRLVDFARVDAKLAQSTQVHLVRPALLRAQRLELGERAVARPAAALAPDRIEAWRTDNQP